MNWKQFISVLLITFLTVSAFGQGKSVPINVKLADKPALVLKGNTISIGQAIKHALDANYDIIAGSYDVAMTDSAYEQYKKKYAPFLDLNAGAKYNKNPDDLAATLGETQKSIDASIAIAKKLPSGTTLSAGLKHEYMRTTYGTYFAPVLDSNGNDTGNQVPVSGALPTEYHNPSAFVSIQQELLKNSFGYNDRREHAIIKNYGKMQRELILFQLSSVVLQVIVDYWNFVLRNAQLVNANLLMKETRYVRNVIAQNVRYGISEKYDLNYYNALLASAEARRVYAEQGSRDAKRILVRRTNLDESSVVEGTAIFSNKLESINIEDAMNRAFKKRADYQNALLQLKNAKMQLEIHENDALPSVIAQINASTYALRNNPGNAYGDTAQSKYPSLEARIQVTHPLEDREQEINERNSKFRYKQAKVRVEQIKKEVRDDVLSKIEYIQTAYTLYEKSKTARRQSEIFYRRLAKNLRRGRMSASIVRDALDGLVQSREQELGALISYNVALLQFTVSKNELFEHYKIDINDYIPKKK